MEGLNFKRGTNITKAYILHPDTMEYKCLNVLKVLLKCKNLVFTGYTSQIRWLLTHIAYSKSSKFYSVKILFVWLNYSCVFLIMKFLGIMFDPSINEIKFDYVPDKTITMYEYGMSSRIWICYFYGGELTITTIVRSTYSGMLFSFNVILMWCFDSNRRKMILLMPRMDVVTANRRICLEN